MRHRCLRFTVGRFTCVIDQFGVGAWVGYFFVCVLARGFLLCAMWDDLVGWEA